MKNDFNNQLENFIKHCSVNGNVNSVKFALKLQEQYQEIVEKHNGELVDNKTKH